MPIKYNKKGFLIVVSTNNLLKTKIYSDKISQYSGYMKETWKITNDLLNKRCNAGYIEFIDKREISNNMNVYFCSVGKKLANKIEDCANPLPVNWSVCNE